MSMKIQSRNKQDYASLKFKFKPRAFKLESIIDLDISALGKTLANQSFLDWKEFISVDQHIERVLFFLLLAQSLWICSFSCVLVANFMYAYASCVVYTSVLFPAFIIKKFFHSGGSSGGTRRFGQGIEVHGGFHCEGRGQDSQSVIWVK